MSIETEKGAVNGFELILPFLRPIQNLILDPEISEIMVNGPERIFIERAGYVQAVPGVKLTPESLMVAVKNIARRLGDDISEAKPILDSRLPDGSRVAAVIPPCSIHGVALTIRKFNSHKFKMKDLIEAGTLTAELAAQLQEYVLQRKNILICGGTGTGKTTLLNLLTDCIPNHERIVLIEDTAEIQIQKDNVLRFEARREQNNLPAVTVRDLLKATLRHRPDRIILGEIRGGEAFDLLQLLNTGHSGTLSTVHANSAAQGISRFTTCMLQSGVEMPYRAIKTNIADSPNVIIQIERRPGIRFVSQVLEIRGFNAEADQYQFGEEYLVDRNRLASYARLGIS
jgi:pilus assembly protein CpaF